MPTYNLSTDDGRTLEADFDLEDSAIILHSRGGTKGKNARNTDYGLALRLILQRLQIHQVPVKGAWVASSRVAGLPLNRREILSASEQQRSPDQLFTLMASRMEKVEHISGRTNSHGNRTKRIRIEVSRPLQAIELAKLLLAHSVQRAASENKRLPASELNKVTAENVWNAVQRLCNGFKDHGFGLSTDFDLIADDDQRLPPKAVFGVAATEALGFPVKPEHFSAGDSTPCFRILREAGYKIVPKAEREATTSSRPPSLPEDEEWTEGQTRLISHLKKERGRGLATAKKVAFKRINGRLSCERCGLDPVIHYKNEEAEACIEVHHKTVQVKDMMDGHKTKLEDLECLCANCHRLVHRLLKKQVMSAVTESNQLSQ